MIIFDPSSLSTISHALNTASVTNVRTQNQLSFTSSEDPKKQLVNSLETLSDLPPATTLSPSNSSAISHALNAASAISTNIEKKLRSRRSEGIKEQHYTSGTLSHLPKATTRTLIAQASTDNSKCGPGQPRDKMMAPFACDSIWNVPIGSNAKYVDAYIGSKGVGSDTDWFVITKKSDPLVQTYMPGAWGKGRCSGTIPQQQAQWHPEASQPLNIPYDLIVPDAKDGYTPNGSAQILKPDGRTLESFTTLTRCQQGGPLYGNWFGEQDIYGDGIDGGHGASGMSSIGGSIRVGELLNDDPIRHALKIDLWGQWLHYNPSSPTPGHRWPARLADFNAPNQYHGSNPALVMGSLLAIPPGVTAESLGLKSKAGKKIFQALQDYGAYVVDDSGFDYNFLCLENDAEQEYAKVTGNELSKDAALQADFAKIISVVKVVDNNGPNKIGGGGTPRQPLPPPIGN